MVSEALNLDAFIGLTGSVFAGAGLFFNGISLRRSAKNEFLKIIRDYQSEITKLETSPDRTDENRYERWGVMYLNFHSQIAYFVMKGFIKEEVLKEDSKV